MRLHNRAIHNCTTAPEDLVEPENCRFTYNPMTRRLYLHIMSWPLKEIHLKGFKGKLKYAQLLNDASEIKFRASMEDENAALVDQTPDGAVTLQLPTVRPKVVIPVIELFLNA